MQVPLQCKQSILSPVNSGMIRAELYLFKDKLTLFINHLPSLLQRLESLHTACTVRRNCQKRRCFCNHGIIGMKHRMMKIRCLL